MTQSRNTNYKSNYECFPNNSIYNFLSNMLTTYFSTRNLNRTFYTGTKVLTLKNGYLMRFYASRYSVFKVHTKFVALENPDTSSSCFDLYSFAYFFLFVNTFLKFVLSQKEI